MKILVSFTASIPGHARAEVIRSAGKAAACAFENAVEGDVEKHAACIASPVRIRIIANKKGEDI